ncbi:MAG: ABC transporter substrate-binding protein [Pseudomonadota bacterium]
MLRTLQTASVALAISGLVSVSSVPVAQADEPQSGGSLLTLVHPEPNTLAAYRSTASSIGEITNKVYEGLLEYDFDLNPQPSLARSWEVSEDGLTITFQLEEGVTFHDGSPFDSSDVKYTIEEVLRSVHPRGETNFAEVTSIDTPDDYTVVFNLANPAPYILYALSSHETPMLNRETFEGTDPAENDTANAPNGTGPFMFTEWERGQYIRLDRNPNYWREGLPYLDRIVARFIADPATRSAAVENGEIDYAAFNAIPYSDADRIDAIDGITVTNLGYEMINPLMMMETNLQDEIMGNIAVRQAISYAIDRSWIIDNIFYGNGVAATGALSSNFSATGLYTDDVRDYEVDNNIEIANQLLDEAGFERGDDGFRFTIIHDVLPLGGDWNRMAEYLKQTLAEIGIDVELRNQDVGAFLQRIYTDYDFQLSATFLFQYADPAIGVHRQYLSDQIRQGVLFVNSAQYSNPEIDAWMAQATNENDPEIRQALYHDIQRQLAEDLPVLPIFEMRFVTVYKDDVINAVNNPMGSYSSFYNVWLDR